MSQSSQLPYSALEHKTWNLLAGWVQRHQVFAFFALTFLFSWSIYAIVSLTSFESETTYSRILGIAGYGPSLSAIWITSIINGRTAQSTGDRKISTYPSVLLVLFSLFFVAGMEWWNNVWWDHPYDVSLLLADAVLIILAVIVIFWLFLNRSEPGYRLLGTQGHQSWYQWAGIALILWPLMITASNLTAGLLKIPLSNNPTWPDIPLPQILFQSFTWALLFGGPLNEEPGWRGFALSRLQCRFSPLVASVILGAFWGLWHVPLHFLNAYGGGAIGAVIRIQEIPRAVIFTWLYNRSKGSLLVMLLLHASINTAGWFLPRSYAVLLVFTILVGVIIVIKDKMWEKPLY